MAYSRIMDAGSAEQAPGRRARLLEMARFAESQLCRRKTLLEYFGDPSPDAPCHMCDRCASAHAETEKTDVSKDARLFLACLEQTREKFGRGHIIHILRGSRNQRVLDWRHDRLKTYGCGQHYSTDKWRSLADRFLDAGIIKAELEHGTIQITDAGREVLAGEPVFVRFEEVRFAARDADTIEYDPVLFERLRQLRMEIANEISMPPFVVFHDSTLMEMSSAYPRDMRSLLNVSGVGERKADTYGERFLQVVRQHVLDHNINPNAPPPGRLIQKQKPSGRRRQIGEAFAEGQDISAIQEAWGVQRSTVIQHLSNYARAGNAIDPERILAECRLSHEERDRVMRAFEQLGHERLSPVFEALGGTVQYEELHLLRTYRIAAQKGMPE